MAGTRENNMLNLLRLWRSARILVIAVSLTPDVHAHDFWIHPAPVNGNSGQAVTIELLVGQDLAGDSVPRIEEWFSRFAVIAPNGQERRVDGLTGDEPAGSFTPTVGGVHTVVYRSTAGFSEQKVAKFEAYAREEGIEHLIKPWLQQQPKPAVAREDYYRCAKALVRIDSNSSGYNAAVGLELELTAVTDPFVMAARVTTFELRFREKPVIGALVVVRNANQAEQRVSARTDALGRVQLEFNQAGHWLVNAVHLVPAPAGSGLTDWVSYWASLTFLREATN